jgi:hypothetical protein
MKIPYILKKLKHNIFFRIACYLNRDFCEYHSFNFDTQKPLPDNAHEEMQLGCRLLDELMVPYRLTDGTILGIHREGEFIKHDNDIDVDVFDIKMNKIDLIITSFLSAGFTIGRRASFKGATHQVIFYNDREVIFDILFWYRKSNEYVNHSERGYIRKQDARYFDNLGKVFFHGQSYSCPPYLEEWLEMRYGKEWKTPKTYKGDWKDDCFDMEKIE